MRSIFNMDGPIFTFLSKMADVAILNILFVITCIPLFTIGTSLTAMSYVALKMREGEEGYIWRSYLKSFKQNFRQSLVIWVILLLIGCVLGTDFLIMKDTTGTVSQVIRVAVFAAAILWLMLVLWVFPMLSRFDNTIKQTLKNSLLLAVANAPRSILMCAVVVAACVVTVWNTYTIVYGIMIWLVFGFALICIINTRIMGPVIDRLMPKEEEEEITSDLDFKVAEDDAEEEAAEAETAGAAENASTAGSVSESTEE